MPSGPLVSVVEDDEFFRESMRRLIRSFGYPVEVFSSAADFLASPLFPKTTCLISDVQMPLMSGLELHRNLVSSGHALPTILVTAFPNDSERARALKEGVVCYIAKPINEMDLKRCILTALEQMTSSRAPS